LTGNSFAINAVICAPTSVNESIASADDQQVSDHDRLFRIYPGRLFLSGLQQRAEALAAKRALYRY
jgi:hypothetical protein